MGAAFSTRRCGVCYFELPEGSKSVKRKIQRVYGLSLDHRGAEAAYEPFDAPLELTKIMDAGYAHLAISTDWPGLQESVLRGCRGCQAISELLLAAAADDEVVLNEESKMVFMWRGRASRTDPHGQFNCVGLLKVRMRVWTASPRQVPFNLAVTLGTRDIKMEDDDVEMEDPGSRVWTFTFDVDCVNAAKDKKHSHPFAYEDPVEFGDTGSERSLQQIKDWVTNCIRTHELCGGEQTRLPYRVLELTTVSDDNTLQVRLVEDVGVEAPYVALSHRWGPSTASCRTLQGNLAEQKENIEWDWLLKTFQDAALVTTRLGIKYLWIDSLCIVQDDAEDWKVQAANMCDIYHRAYVTLAASCSDDSTQGLFRKSSCCRTVKSGDKGSSYLMRRIPEHPTWDVTGIMQMQTELPLLTRSWVYQERLLSPRIAYFTRYEVVFECSQPGQGPSYCQCHNIPGGLWGASAGDNGSGPEDSTGRKLGHAEALRTLSSFSSPSPPLVENSSDRITAEVRRYWNQITEEYSGYSISSTSDKLPALAGIARQFGTAHPELGRYVAGMWEHTLVQNLMWYSKTDVQVRAMYMWRPPHIAPPESGSFPTWSWIAAGQKVSNNSACTRVRPEDLRVLSFNFELSGPDEYGAIRDASLLLEGFVAAGRLVRIGPGLSGERVGFQGASGDPWYVYRDYAFFEASPDLLEVDMDIFCMKTGFAWAGNHLVVVLRRMTEEEDGTGVFERIGMITDATRAWMDSIFSQTTSPTRIKII